MGEPQKKKTVLKDMDTQQPTINPGHACMHAPRTRCLPVVPNVSPSLMALKDMDTQQPTMNRGHACMHAPRTRSPAAAGGTKGHETRLTTRPCTLDRPACM